MDIARIIKLPPGHYVVAVSGGVDSVVLLDILAKQGKGLRVKGEAETKKTTPSTLNPKPLSFTVAHFDHGIREDSYEDRVLVRDLSHSLGFPFVYEEGQLGAETSEAIAREARYDFLRKVQNLSDAQGIITAHHLDDAAETAVLNLMRGTGRKGMTSLGSREGIHRPLLHVPKDKLKAYAEANGLKWREDSTNKDQSYKRNYVRHSVLAKAKKNSPAEYNRLLMILRRQRELNHAIDTQLATLLHVQPARDKLRRRDIIQLPYQVACELVAEWLRDNGKRQLSRWLVERLTIAIRTAQPNTSLLLDSGSKVSFTKANAQFVRIV